MASTGMRLPSRPAPPPPRGGKIRGLQRSSTVTGSWNLSNRDPVASKTIQRSQSTYLNHVPGERKKPPPRPPPPKFTPKNQPQRPCTPGSRDLMSNLLTGTRLRMNSQFPPCPVHPSVSAEPDLLLIDWNSPPSSPTPTTRSSSDGVSVDSFGSDGASSANTPIGGSSGNTSQAESGFEDDFDFGFPPVRSSVDTVSVDDPFSLCFRDSLATNSQQPNAAWQQCEVRNNSSQWYVSSCSEPKTKLATIPTIIRPKPKGPPRQQSKEHSKFTSSSMRSDVVSGNLGSDSFGTSSRNNSPPMPSIPPPPPPLDISDDLGEQLPELPPRPTKLPVDDVKRPHGIALYDYPASHPDDLPFQADDVILLVRQINSEWFYGEVNGRQGMFPTNFIKVTVPLPKECEPEVEVSAPPIDDVVTALYTFVPETWDDLGFQEGDKIRVLRRVNNDWLYGELDGRKGQFPVTFVDDIPSFAQYV